MRRGFKYGLFIGFVSLFYACEKVIDIPLNDAEVQTVIEGVLNDAEGNNYILLSKTTTVYAQSDFPTISGASVVVTDSHGSTFVFEEVDTVPGRYTAPELTVQPETTYMLEVNIDGAVFTAESYAHKTPKIDSITTVQQDFGFSEFLGYIPHTVYFHSFDDGAVKNFYRFKISVNNRESSLLYIGNDEFINGQYFSAPFLGDLTTEDDSVEIVMHACDQAYYNYLFSFSNASGGGGPFTAAPGNPVSNIQGEKGIGYFTALTTDTLTHVVGQ